MLKRLLGARPLIRIIEAHSGLTGLIAETVSVESDNKVREFDGIWMSNLTDSAVKAKPDIEYVDITSRMADHGGDNHVVAANEGGAVVRGGSRRRYPHSNSPSCSAADRRCQMQRPLPAAGAARRSSSGVF